MSGSRNKWYNELSPDGVEAGSSNDFVSVRGEGWATRVLTWRGKEGEIFSGFARAPRYLPHSYKSHWVSYLHYIPSGLLCKEMALSKGLLTDKFLYDKPSIHFS